MSIHIRHVVVDHSVAAADVIAPDGKGHRIGHLPGEGWFCTTCQNKRCAQIKHVTDLIPDLPAKPAKAAAP